VCYRFDGPSLRGDKTCARAPALAEGKEEKEMRWPFSTHKTEGALKSVVKTFLTHSLLECSPSNTIFPFLPNKAYKFQHLLGPYYSKSNGISVRARARDFYLPPNIIIFSGPINKPFVRLSSAAASIRAFADWRWISSFYVHVILIISPSMRARPKRVRACVCRPLVEICFTVRVSSAVIHHSDRLYIRLECDDNV
jgi:hypothetical protein